MPSRREYLALLTAGTITIAGCGSEDTSPGTPEIEDSPTPGSTQTPDSSGTPSPTRTPGAVESPDSIDTTVLNIRDFGAQVDGMTDDTLAVRDAIAAAESGDTVWFPQGTTVVSTQHSEDTNAIELNGDTIPDNLTLAGVGYNSVIQLKANQEKYHNVINLIIKSGINGLTIRQLRIDGNKSQQTETGGHGIFSDNAASQNVPVDVLVQNVWVENSSQSGITPRHGGIVINRCTVRNCNKHGLSPDSMTDVHKYDPPILVKNTYATGNGKAGNAVTYGIDCSGGKIIVEDCVCEDNAQGTKTTEEGIEITYRRVRLKNNDKFGYIRAGEDTTNTTLVTFDNVVSEQNTRAGFRFSKDTEYRIPTGVLATQNGRNNVVITKDARVQAENIWANRAVNSYGLTCESTAGGEVSNYYAYRNDQGAIQRRGNLTILLTQQQDKSDIESVPTASDVGATSVYRGRDVPDT